MPEGYRAWRNSPRSRRAAIWIVYMALRLVFFLPAVSWSPKSASGSRVHGNWAAETSGGYWVFCFAVLLPVAIVAGIASRALTGGMSMMALPIASHAASPAQALAAILNRLRGVWPLLLALDIVYVTLMTGLALGAIANAYKARRRRRQGHEQASRGPPTIRFAYGFAFGQLGTIIGLIWAPMVVIAGAALPALWGWATRALSPDQNLAAFNAAQLRIVIFGLASLFFYACVCVSVTPAGARPAQGQRDLPLRRGDAPNCGCGAASCC